MPLYDFKCGSCGKTASVFVRSVNSALPVNCPDCGSTDFHQAISRFAFHKSMETKLHELDPKYEKMIDDSNPDLSMDNLVKRYRLDQSLTTDERGAPDF